MRVVKETRGSGGYGMLVGPQASAGERAAFAAKLKARPDDYIAQPTLALSTCPTFVESGVAPRHVDLRPFVLSGKEVHIVSTPAQANLFIVNPFSGRRSGGAASFANLFSTHPPTEARIARLHEIQKTIAWTCRNRTETASGLRISSKSLDFSMSGWPVNTIAGVSARSPSPRVVRSSSVAVLSGRL